MFEATAVLKKESSRTLDQYANEILTYTERTVYVYPRSVYRAEFYSAAQAGMHPTITFDMTNYADYEGEKIVIFNGVEYDVVRTDWNGQRDRISLICEERTRNIAQVPATGGDNGQ